jgi:hypothetical protein
MKATIEVPNDLYRQVKAKSALEGRAIREVTVDLYRRYVKGDLPAVPAEPEAEGSRSTPSWFGALGRSVPAGTRHEMSAIRESIARGISQDRDL